MKITTIALAFLFAASVTAGPSPGSGKALGSPTAPIVLDLYSDFQCPHCKELHDEVLPSLIADFVDTGKVYLVRRYFMLPRPLSRPAATYVCAAERIGKYNLVADYLFKTQAVWAQADLSKRTPDSVLDEAVSKVLSPADMQKVRALVKDPSVTAEVDKDQALGTSEHVNQTPTMIIVHKGTHTPIAGTIDYSLLKMYLNQVLAK